jgi:4,4'-diaponeurosporenoate glycosyltransferase
MMTLLQAFAWLLWAAGFRLLPRLRGCGKPPGANPQGLAGRLSVIIPARNEAHNLPALLGSLAAQSVRPLEIIVVDDGSDDGTAEVARGGGARVIQSLPLPDDWRGKPWACHQGAQAATGELLCFVDADTRFALPDGLEKLLAAWPGGAFSTCPWHAVEHAWEHLSLFFNLNMVLGTAPEGLFGPLLLIDRQSYRDCGGHTSVRDKVLENFRLAEHCREAGVPVRSTMGSDIISFRMYPGGMSDMIEGWTKGFASGAGRTPGRVMAWIIAWLTGLMIIAIGLPASGFDWPWAALYLAATLQTGLFARRAGDFRWWLAPLFPLALVFFFGLFALSSSRSGRPVTWKGRKIDAD